MLKTKDFKNCSSYISASKNFDEFADVLISTDTRLLREGEFFLAISGERFNALTFLKQVKEKGCKYIIYTKNEKNDELIKPFLDDFVFFETKSSIKFLQEITSILSLKFQKKGGKLIAISGSNGKTTTKEMLYHLLKSVHEETICTQKNNNNHIGVPLTLLQITDKTKFAIVELGSNHPGEIEVLCDIVKPVIGYTTNIGDTHMEFFETKENVFKEEGFLCESVLSSKLNSPVYFVNSDDEYLKRNLDMGLTRSVGTSGVDYNFNIEKESAVVKNNMDEYNINNKFITGKHNFFNLCAAFSIAKEIDSLNTTQYLEAAKSFKPTTNRSQWLDFHGAKVFLDAYNANPSSMLSAIDGFVEHVGSNAEYCLILGDMYELGKNSETYHYNLSASLASKGYKNIYFVGKFASHYNSGFGKKGKEFLDVDSFKNTFMHEVLKQHKYVFIKGSRSLQLESLVDIN